MNGTKKKKKQNPKIAVIIAYSELRNSLCLTSKIIVVIRGHIPKVKIPNGDIDKI